MIPILLCLENLNLSWHCREEETLKETLFLKPDLCVKVSVKLWYEDLKGLI